MASFGDLVSGPFAQLFYTLLGGQQQQKAYDEAKASNEQRYNQGLSILDKLDPRLRDLTYKQNTKETNLAAYAGQQARTQGQTLSNQTNQGYQGREKDVLQYLRSALPELETAYGTRSEQGLSNFDTGAKNVDLGYGDLANRVRGQYGDVGTELDTGYRELEAKAAGLGDQQKIDIAHRFDQQGAIQQADAAARGLTGSTIAPSLKTGTEREKSAELRRLQDDLTRQQIDIGNQRLGAQERLGTQGVSSAADISREGLGTQANMTKMRADLEAMLTGDTLSQRSRDIAATGEARSSLSADRLNAMNDVGRWNTALGYDTNMGLLNTIGRGNDRAYGNATDEAARRMEWIYNRNDSYPNNNAWQQLAYNYGQNGPEPPKQKTNWFAPLLGAAGQVGGGWATGKAYKGNCIDGNAEIATPIGMVPLCGIKIGDTVLDADGVPRKVVNRDFGKPHPNRMGDYVALVCDDGSLVLTKDHVIDGKPAGEWMVGETIRRQNGASIVRSVHWTPARNSGDLQLENDAPYIANGFIVHSMFEGAVPMSQNERYISDDRPSLQGVRLEHQKSIGDEPVQNQKRGRRTVVVKE